MDPCRRDGLFGSLAVGDVAPRADDLVRLAALVMDQAQFLAHPATLFPYTTLFRSESVVAFLEQLSELALDPCKIVRMHRISPEIGTLEIVSLFVAQPVTDVLADIGWATIPRCLEAVDHRRRGGEQLFATGAGRGDGLFGSLAVGDVAPRADDLVRLAALVMDHAQFFADPAVLPAFPTRRSSDLVVAFLEQLSELALDPCKIVRMHRISPEIGTLEIV